MAKTLTIGGKEYPINITYRAQRYSIEKYPIETLKSMTIVEAHDYTLDLVMQILVKPHPFEAVGDNELPELNIMDALSPEEFREIDDNIAGMVLGTAKADAPGK